LGAVWIRDAEMYMDEVTNNFGLGKYQNLHSAHLEPNIPVIIWSGFSAIRSPLIVCLWHAKQRQHL
jgi:hypothetical protein